MKTYLITVCLLWVTQLGYGQAREDTVVKKDKPITMVSGFIGISAGVAIPIGSYTGKGFYALSKPGIDLGPLVEGGYGVTISFGKPVAQSDFGIGASAGYYANSFDINKYVLDLNNEAVGMFLPISAGNYNVYTLMAGPFCTLPDGKLSFDIGLLAGPMIVNTPGISYKGINVTMPNPAENTWYIQSVTFLTSTFNIKCQIS